MKGRQEPAQGFVEAESALAGDPQGLPVFSSPVASLQHAFDTARGWHASTSCPEHPHLGLCTNPVFFKPQALSSNVIKCKNPSCACFQYYLFWENRLSICSWGFCPHSGRVLRQTSMQDGYQMCLNMRRWWGSGCFFFFILLRSELTELGHYQR